MNPSTDSNKLTSSAARLRGKVMPATLAVVAIIALGGIIWGVVTMAGSGDAAQSGDVRTAGPVWFDVKKINLELALVASGELETKRKVEIKSQVEGVTTIVEVVPEGSYVKQGDVLMRLADDDIRTRIEQEQLNLEQARADHVWAQQTLAIDQTDAESQLRAAQVKLDLAKLDLAKWESGDDPQKIRELNLALEKAKRTLTRDKRDLELSMQLYDQKFISLSELEDDQIAVIESENALKTATQAIAIYNNYTRPKEHQKLLSDVAQAEEELQRTKHRTQSNLARSQANLVTRTRTLRIREERYQKLQEQLQATVITAPKDGLVVYGTTVGSRNRRSDPIAQGRQVRLNELLIVLPDVNEMVASVKINETMMPMIKLGQVANVTSDFRPGKIMEGRVAQIGVMAEDGGWFNPDVREYAVRIDLPPGIDDTLKPAMRCSARIMVGQLDDVIAVPLQAVITEGRSRYVYIPASGGKVQRRMVTIGQNNESMVEIKSGLEEGDRVLLRRPRPGELLNPSDAPGTLEEAAPQEDASRKAPADGMPAARPQASKGAGEQTNTASTESVNASAETDKVASGDQSQGETPRRRSPNGPRRSRPDGQAAQPQPTETTTP